MNRSSIKHNFELDANTFKISKWVTSARTAVEQRTDIFTQKNIMSRLKKQRWRMNGNSTMQQSIIHYQTHANDILPKMLSGFFEGWPDPPTAETHLRILRGSSHIVLALNPERTCVIGFITAVSDGVSCAFIPYLEVLPIHRKGGIGRNLVKKMIEELNGIYAIDLMCDEGVVPFYEKLGLHRSTGMVIRNHHNQSGLPIKPHQLHW